MSLDRADVIIKTFQKENPRLYDALSQLSAEIRRVIVNAVISQLLLDPDFIYNNVGLKYFDEFKSSFSTDRESGKFNIGGRVGAVPNAVLQVDGNLETTNSAQEVVAIGRKNLSSAQPLASFGLYLALRLQGFTVGSEPEAGRIQLVWEQNQTNDTTQRDSTVSLWNMVNNVLTQRFSINSSGAISFDPTAYPAGRFIYTGASGALVTDPQILYDDVNDIVSFISSHATNPQLHIRQDSTGDAYVRFSLVAARSYAVGIDNSDSDVFKLSTAAAANAVPGTSDLIGIDSTGRVGIGVGPASSFKVQIDKAAGAEAVVLALAQNDTNTTPSLSIIQSSTGDVSERFSIGSGNSFIVGLDNSDGDFFKVSYGSAGNATLGTNDRLVIDLSGRIVIRGSTFTSGRLVQLNHFEEGAWLFCEAAFLNPAIVLNNTASGGKQWQLVSSATGGIKAGQFTIRDNTALSNRFGIDTNGNVIIGPEAALATTATNGFLYVPSCAGTPTGTPTAVTGKIPLVYDSTNNILYAFSNAAWRAH